MKKVPAWVIPYCEFGLTEEDYERIGRRYDNPGLKWLVFKIPGLAPIQYDHTDNRWRAADARWKSYLDYGQHQYENPYPTIRDAYWRSSLDTTLVVAQANYEQHLKDLEAYKEAQAKEDEAMRQWSERQAEEEESELVHADIALEQQKDEAERLLSALRDDTAALYLVKAYIAIRQERKMFEARLDDADYTLYSLEERYTRQAALLRRQAEQAERLAFEERTRASDLEDDLNKVNKRVNSLEQGW